jgi:hypothetical protein
MRLPFSGNYQKAAALFSFHCLPLSRVFDIDPTLSVWGQAFPKQIM